MRALGFGLLVFLLGCATAAPSHRWESSEYGFAIDRPVEEGWRFTTGHEAPAGIRIPVVVSHTSGAQVVVQIAPEVAAAEDFAQKLAVGLTERHGFLTSVPEALDELRTEFLFATEGVYGRVNVLRGEGRLFVLLGTWPSDAPEEVSHQVEAIMRSLQAAPSRSPRQRIFAHSQAERASSKR